ncbi:MAG: hypothetical protein IJH34_16435 [Romboutsia sp.]|nr:hypothetical protein [Romboutsia sp.]
MKLKSKLKTISASLAVLSIISTPVLALTQYGNGSAVTYESDNYLGYHSVGVKKSFGGANTYGFSWVDPSNNSVRVYSQLTIGGVTFNKAYGVGYAQSSQEYRPGNVAVSESHGTY